VTRRFYHAGYNVALGDIAIAAADTLARDLSSDQSSAFAVKLDVTSGPD
jgi:3-oxoacyl-[acyl-carrier protein] reductase